MFGIKLGKSKSNRGDYDVTGNGVVSVRLSYLLNSNQAKEVVKLAKQAKVTITSK